jgi:Ser/Thr protein kinase RdoA (MazF antagonist)
MLKTRLLDAPGVTDLQATAAIAATVYGFSDAAVLERFTLTENATYRVSEARLEPIVIRVYRPGGRPEVEVQSELAWMSALRDDLGPILPAVLTGDDGVGLVQVVPGGGAPSCFCVAFSLAPGVEPNEDDLVRWFPRLGEITASFHQQARRWRRPTWFSRPTWDVSTTLGDRPHWGPWRASVADEEERQQLQELADVVTQRLTAFGTGAERFGLVHADLRLANLVADGESIQVIDFDDCGLSWYLYDLACALTFNEARADVNDLIASWVNAYRQVEPLSRADEDEIPTFLMLRRLMLSAYVGLRPDIELAAELAQNGYAAETCHLAEAYLGRYGRSSR